MNWSGLGNETEFLSNSVDESITQRCAYMLTWGRFCCFSYNAESRELGKVEQLKRQVLTPLQMDTASFDMDLG